MMEYSQAISLLFKSPRFGKRRASLDNMRELTACYDHPERSFKSVHIAGTNGKGSTSMKIATALQAGGYKVGLFTSPHISSYRERIRIDGQMISEGDTADILSDIYTTIESKGLFATFFEITTLLALIYFKRQNVDIVVMETGLGGRLDATNILNPCLVVITSIGYDHADVLGDSLDAIATEKAGIIKQGVSTILGPKALSYGIQDIAKSKNSNVIEVKGVFSDYDLENGSIAGAALQELCKILPLSDDVIELGLKASLSCRCESLDNPYDIGQIVLDVAHNIDGLLKLIDTLKERFPMKPLRFAVGFSKGKDAAGFISVIGDCGYPLHLITSHSPYCLAIGELENLTVSQKPSGYVKEVLADICRLAAQNNELLVVCGTFYIMDEVRAVLDVDRPL